MSIRFLRRLLPALLYGIVALQLSARAPLRASAPDTTYQYHITLTRSLADYVHEVLAPIHPKIGLVLSGGGARGLAQIGVLKVLEQEHIPIHCIVGTSIGALVGGLYASGYSADELDSIARTTDWNDILAFGDESSRRELSYDQKLEYDRSILTLQLDGLTPVLPEAASQGKRLSAFINKLVWNALYHAWGSFDDLKYPFRAVTTDLVSGKRITIDHGNLADAMRASATAPLRFTPITRDSLILVDGGLLSNIPVDVVHQCGCDIVIVVNTTSPLHERADLSTPLNVADQVVTIMMQQQYAKELAQANIVITPQLGEHGAADFDNIDSLITQGEIGTRTMISAIRDTIQHQPTFTALDPPGNGNIKQIIVTGVSQEYKGIIDSMVQPLTGKVYTAQTCLPSFEDILRFYRRHGLSFATVACTQFEIQTGTLSITIDEGILRSISVEGNTKTKESVILRELALAEGSPFRTDDAQRSLANLNSSELFRQTALEAIPSPNGVALRVRVTEKTQPVVRLIGKADNEYNTQVGIQIANDNLLGRGVELGGLFYAGLRNNTEELTLASRRVLTTYLTYDLTLYNRQRNVLMYVPLQTAPNDVELLETGEYSEDRIGGTFSFGENVPQFGLVSVVARYEQQRMTSLSGAGLSGSDRVASLAGQLRMDTQDKFPFPRSGSVLDASYEAALRLLGANVAFTKVSFSYEAYLSYNNANTFHPRIMWGYEDQTTPTIDQFRLGGQDNFFGLRQDQYLGNQIFAAGLEYRYMLPFRVYFDTYAKVRYDIGAVWPEVSTIQFGDLRHGVGISLAFDTPLGMADFAVGRSFVLANPLAGRPLAEFTPVFFYFTVGRGL